MSFQLTRWDRVFEIDSKDPSVLAFQDVQHPLAPFEQVLLPQRATDVTEGQVLGNGLLAVTVPSKCLVNVPSKSRVVLLVWLTLRFSGRSDSDSEVQLKPLVGFSQVHCLMLYSGYPLEHGGTQ